MNDKATDHYNITLHEIEQGTSIQELRSILQSYQDAELYEECQGIHLAIEIVAFNVLTQLIKETKKQKLKIKWTQK
jgi:hypothetical protein